MSGARRVKFQGREVEYHSAAELLNLIGIVRGDLEAVPGARPAIRRVYIIQDDEPGPGSM